MVRAETDAIRAASVTAENDTREVMRLVQKNDDELKQSLASVVSLIGSESQGFKDSVTELAGNVDVRIRELQLAATSAQAFFNRSVCIAAECAAR